VYGAWAHICGTDLIRDVKGRYLVLEDNLRVPSGVSYMVENREITKRVLPELFEDLSIQPVSDYTLQLYTMLASLSPRKRKRPSVVLLTPGIYNSAYFEHAFLAQGMGAELVEGSDLFTEDECVYMRTVGGPQRVDVIYRRIDDDFIDPEVFREDSALGVPGLMAAWRAGNVAIANAPGCGVADDKVIYAFVPDMIRYYLKQDPIIENVKTYLCMREADKEYVLENLDKLVVKPANESGGSGIMVGPHSTRAAREECARHIVANPRNYIAQPTIALSTAPTLCDGAIEPRFPVARSYSRFEAPPAVAAIASIAASASGARPRLVCRMTPVALSTGTSDRASSASSSALTTALHPSADAGGGTIPVRTRSTALRIASVTVPRGALESSGWISAASRSAVIDGRARRASDISDDGARERPSTPYRVVPLRGDVPAAW
jgi:uncharacterized circularly permuted ATP-grasp superfamily protein